jgi:N-acetylglucosamine-6-phosphate deacetylase
MPSVSAARVITPTGVLAPGAVDVEDGRIVAVSATSGRVQDVTLAPGFIDVQLNGYDDVDVAVADNDDWDRLDELLLRQGVTAWCPTIVTSPLNSYSAALARVTAAATTRGPASPTMLGVHLEGPFLGGAPGAHDPDLIRTLDLDWLASLPPIVRLMTLAPEQPTARDAIRALAARDVVVALGHSTASYEEATAAIDAGARLVTHCFNGMGPLHHRRPGLVGAALSDNRVAVSVIADLQHVHPAAVGLVFRAKPRGKVVLVSDAIAWRVDGVRVVDGAAQFADGTLVGAIAGLDQAVANTVLHAGVDLFDAVYAASTAPADLLGLADRGRIAPGARADFVALDDELRVTGTWIAGDQVA